MLNIEREVIINWNLVEPDAHIFTAQEGFKNKLLKLGFTPYRKRDGGYWFKIPKELIIIRNPNRKKVIPPQLRAKIPLLRAKQPQDAEGVLK